MGIVSAVHFHRRILFHRFWYVLCIRYSLHASQKWNFKVTFSATANTPRSSIYIWSRENIRKINHWVQNLYIIPLATCTYIYIKKRRLLTRGISFVCSCYFRYYRSFLFAAYTLCVCVHAFQLSASFANKIKNIFKFIQIIYYKEYFYRKYNTKGI